MNNYEYLQENYKSSTIKKFMKICGFKNETELNNDTILTGALMFELDHNLQDYDVLHATYGVLKKLSEKKLV
jgi:hypothetical protein